MVVEKCIINIEDTDMMVYFNDGKKIEEEIENFPIIAAMLGYDFKIIKLEDLRCTFFEFNKHDSNGHFGHNADISLSFDWGRDGNNNIILSQICLEKHEGINRKISQQFIDLNIDTSYKDVEEIFNELKKSL